MGLYLGQEFVKIGDKTNSFTMRLKTGTTPTPTPSTELKFGDRIDDKATVVGEFNSSDLGSLYFAVLDAQYRENNIQWAQSSIINSLTDLPLYSSDEALNAKESATFNTNYVINFEDNGAFTYCRSIEPLNFNNKKYDVQLPNAYELLQIFNNRETLDTYDITIEDNATKELSNWGFDNVYPEVLTSTRDKQFGYGFHLNYNNDTIIWRGNPGKLAVAPIIEIPKSDLQ